MGHCVEKPRNHEFDTSDWSGPAQMGECADPDTILPLKTPGFDCVQLVGALPNGSFIASSFQRRPQKGA